MPDLLPIHRQEAVAGLEARTIGGTAGKHATDLGGRGGGDADPADVGPPEHPFALLDMGRKADSERPGFAGALDWQMCLMCLDPDETDPPGHCRAMAETLRAEALRWTPLGGHVSDTPLIRSRDHGISSLNLES